MSSAIAAGGVPVPATAAAPPYPAALTISGPSWRSRLAHNGQVPLIHPEIHIGLLAANDIVVSDRQASRLHAVIRWTPTGYVVQDLNSTSGTLVNGQRITAPTALVPGQHIRIGDTEFLFQQVQVQENATSPAPSTAPAPATATATITAGAPAPATMGAGPAAVTAMPAQAIASIAERTQSPPDVGTQVSAWLAAQRDKHYWRVFLGILAAYIIVWQLSTAGGGLNPHVIPLVMILSSVLIPVTFVVFCWDQGAVQDIAAPTLGLALLGGGVAAIVFVTILNLLFSDLANAPIFIGAIEETGKAAAVLWFLRDRRLRSELDGLVLGAAVGMGFAMIETAGYGFDAFTHGAVGFVAGATGGSITYGDVYQIGFNAMVQELNLRMVLALFGHGVWTAIIAAAIWRERGRPLGESAPSILLAWGISVCLHALYDALAGAIDSIIPQVIIGIVGLFILRFFVQEAVERAKLGPDAPAPPPLLRALLNYMEHPLSRFVPRPVAHPAAFAAAAVSAAPAGAGPATSPAGAMDVQGGADAPPITPEGALASATVPPDAAAAVTPAPPLAASAGTPALSTDMPTIVSTSSTTAADIPTAGAVMQCPQCGAENPTGVRFCTHCGHTLEPGQHE